MSNRCAYIIQSIDVLTSLIQSIPSSKKIENIKDSKPKKQTKARTHIAHISRIVFLGTASAQPMPLKRNVSSLVIQTSTGKLWMVDCGEGTQHQLKLSTLKLSKLRNIFITHLHGDHCYGLFGLFNTIRIAKFNHNVFNIYGPKGIKKIVQNNLQLSRILSEFKINFHELSLSNNEKSKVVKINDDEKEKAMIFSTKDTIDLGEIEPGIKCIACRITHRMETFGYVFIGNDGVFGKLNAQKAMQLGAKGKQLGLLAKGYDVTLANGTVIYSKDVVAPVRGKKVAIMQDCCDCRSCFDVAKNCDLLIHESTFDENHKQMAFPTGHSTAKMAALNAVKVNAKMLVLTHFSSRFVQENVDISVKVEVKDEENVEEDLIHTQRLQMEAEEMVKNNKSNCLVRCAADFMSLRFGKNGVKIDKELAVKKANRHHFQHDLPYLRLISDK